MSDFERYAARRIIERAKAAGVEIPPGLATDALCSSGSYAARRWADEHPDEQDAWCCWGGIMNGPAGCDCWTPVYVGEQADPVPPRSPGDIQTRPAMCGDCAFKPGSPERADEWTAEALYASAAEGTPFWCHDGMRKPVKWVHPDGREVPGDPDDWQPPKLAGIPYRADGQPGMLCAGWAAVAAANHRREDTR